MSSKEDSDDESSLSDSSPRVPSKRRKGFYELERIVGRRVHEVTGQVQYKCHWTGYPDSSQTWEPRTNLDDAEAERSAKRFDRQYVVQGLKRIAQMSGNEESAEYYTNDGDSQYSADQDFEDMMSGDMDASSIGSDVETDEKERQKRRLSLESRRYFSPPALLRSIASSMRGTPPPPWSNPFYIDQEDSDDDITFRKNNKRLRQSSNNLKFKKRRILHRSCSEERFTSIPMRKKNRIPKTDNKTGLFFDIRCAFHAGAPDEPESPARYKTCIEGLTASGISNRCVRIPSILATDEDVLLVHDKKLLDILKRGREQKYAIGYKNLDNSLYVNTYTYEASLLSAGAAIEITKRVYSGTLENGMCLTRPPGHHCTRAIQSGFCHLNNIAIAAQHLRKKYLDEGETAPKVAIVDWDVHHGNGTEEIFRSSKEVLFLSMHQYYSDAEDDADGLFFPGTGELGSVGDREARGKTVNLPLPIGCGDREFRSLFDDLVIPILDEFQPDIVMVSAGFDAAVGDPLGSLEVTPQMFGYMTSLLMKFPKLVLFLEGGYDPKIVSQCVIECTRALLGEKLQYSPSPSENSSFLSVLSKFIRTHRTYWNNVKLPKYCENIKITKVVQSLHRKKKSKQKSEE